MEVIAYVGPAGAGKSYRAFSHRDSIGRPPYVVMLRKDHIWWDGYEGHEIILLDDFGRGVMDWTTFKRVTDVYPYRVERKGASMQLRHTKVIISSTELPCWWFSDVDNWKSAPEQLYRRLTRVMYCRDIESDPVEIDKRTMSWPTA